MTTQEKIDATAVRRDINVKQYRAAVTNLKRCLDAQPDDSLMLSLNSETALVRLQAFGPDLSKALTRAVLDAFRVAPSDPTSEDQ